MRSGNLALFMLSLSCVSPIGCGQGFDASADADDFSASVDSLDASVNGWYRSLSESQIRPAGNGVRWSPVTKPTTLHRYFAPVRFQTGKTVTLSLTWKSDGRDGSNRDFDCSRSNPTGQGDGISDDLLRCLAGTGDFRIGLFQSGAKVGNNSCEGNRERTNCTAGRMRYNTTSFNEYRGFQVRIEPHLSGGFSDRPGRLIEKKGNGDEESHNNLSLWTRIGKGENGLMSDECQAIDHCGYSKDADWGAQPVSFGPTMPFGAARQLKVAITKTSSDSYRVAVTLNGKTAPTLSGRFKSGFTPDAFDTLAITYTNQSRKYDYVEITDVTVNQGG